MIRSKELDTKATLLALFRRRGANGRYMRLFDDMDTEEQNVLLHRVVLNRSELPIIGSVKDETKGMMLTTQRLLWWDDDIERQLAVSEITEVRADFRAMQAAGATKLDMNELQIITSGGLEYRLQLEPGPPLSGMWAVLRHLSQRNRKGT